MLWRRAGRRRFTCTGTCAATLCKFPAERNVFGFSRMQTRSKAADRVLCCSRHCFAAKEKIQSCLSTINWWLCARRLKGGDLRLSHRIQARQRIHTPSGLLGNVTTRSQHLTNWRGESRRRELWGKKLECAASRREKKVKRGNARTESPVRPLAVVKNSGLKCCR